MTKNINGDEVLDKPFKLWLVSWQDRRWVVAAETNRRARGLVFARVAEQDKRMKLRDVKATYHKPMILLVEVTPIGGAV